MASRATLLAGVLSCCSATDFYISSSNVRSSDSNTGTDPENPWRTLQRGQSAPLQAGDSLNLLWGDVFMLHGNDTWYFSGLRGTSSSPITFRAYSDSSSPPPVRPLLLKAPGGLGSVLTLDNSSGVHLQDLQLSGGDHGIIVTLDVAAGASETVYSGFHFVDLQFSHIRGLSPSTGSASWWGAAIAFAAKHAGVVATDVLLQGLAISDSDTVFINSIAVPGYTRVYMSGLTLTDCSFTRIGYNSVFLDTLNNTVIQGNVFYRNTPPYLFYAGTTDIILGSTDASVALLDNEIGWRGEYEPGGPDGCAIDFETSAQGTIVAGNYIHDSYGAGIMVLGHSTTSHDLKITGNTMIANGCGQVRPDHGGISFLQPNSTGVISGNVFTPCPGNSPPVFAPRDPSFLSGWTITGNIIDGSNGTVLVLPPLQLDWIAFNGSFIVTVQPCTACPPGSTLVYSTAGRPFLSSPSTHPWPMNSTSNTPLPLVLPPTGRGIWAKALPPAPGQWAAGTTVVEGPAVGDVLVWPRG